MMMRSWRDAVFLAIGLATVACGSSAMQSSPPPASPAPSGSASQLPAGPAASGAVSDEKLRNELLLRVRSDQAAREAFMLKQRTTGMVDSGDVARLSSVDTENTRWLSGVIARQGWPTKAQVGAQGVRDALLLVQHADLDTAFQNRVLPLVQRSFTAGDLPGADVAMLTDRVAVNHGRAQVYGTQAKLVDGRWVAAPIADSASVDARRATMGLPPLRVYFRILDSLYALPR
jgi:hypothetical protein